MRTKRARRPSLPDERETVGFRRRRERRERAVAFLAGAPLLVGLDLAKRRHAVWIVKRDLMPIKRLMVPHSYEGITTLLDLVEVKRNEGGHDRALFFMEATSYFWENVASLLECRGLEYRLVSPLAVDRQREIEHQTYAKGDYRDAELIVRLGQQGQWLERRLERERIWLDLRALAREHEVLLEAEIAERLRVRCLLGLAIPEVFDHFQNPLKKTARALLKRLTRPTCDLPATFAALVERARDVEGHRLARGKLRAFLARLEAGPLFGVERALAPCLARLGLSVDRFEFFAEQREDVRRRLVELYERTPYRRVLDTIPGVGPECHALLLGMIGDPKRYDRATCLAKLAGTEPRENHSGDAEGRHSISRRGQSPLRHLLYRIVSALSLANQELGAYLQRLRKREENPMSWQQAVVATGNKYLRVVHHMCIRDEVYDPAKLRA
jgi:transposase